MKFEIVGEITAVETIVVNERIRSPAVLRGLAIQEAYRAACVSVLLSWQENFGIAVADAMASACTVISSDRVGLAAMIDRCMLTAAVCQRSWASNRPMRADVSMAIRIVERF